MNEITKLYLYIQIISSSYNNEIGIICLDYWVNLTHACN